MNDAICPRCRRPCRACELACYRRCESCYLDANTPPYDRFRSELDQKRVLQMEAVMLLMEGSDDA